MIRGLSAAHLVVDYPAAEQFVHPYRVLLAVIQIVYPQPLEVEVGEFLVRPVVLRAYVTVESTVIEVCQAVFEVGRLLAQPFGKAPRISSILLLASCMASPSRTLTSRRSPSTHLRTVLVMSGEVFLRGVFQKVQAVVLTGLRADGILLRDLHVRRLPPSRRTRPGWRRR